MHTKPLTNAAGLRSARVGGFRVVFEVDDQELFVDVVAVGPRGDVYRDL